MKKSAFVQSVFGFAVTALLLGTGPLAAAPAGAVRSQAVPVLLQSAQAAPVLDAGEAVAVEDSLQSSLSRMERDESVSAYWPVAPGRRISIVLTRHDVYAADALIVSVESGREVSVPRSRLRFFWGATAEDDATRVLVTWDPDKKTLDGVSWSGSAVYRVRPDPKSAGAYRLSKAVSED